MLNIDYTDEQKLAIQESLDYFKSPTAKPRGYLALGGFAGTGKTTVIRTIVEQLGSGKTAVASFTGKAVSVLRRKGLSHAETLHSLMYHPVKDDDGQFRFVRNYDIWPDYIIIDEASMVNTQLYQDLCYFRKPMLMVGDPGQLEPVGDNPHLIAAPDILLKTIHRQAAENPIVQLATKVRLGGVPDYGESELLCVRPKSSGANSLLEVDQVICTTNAQRKTFNKMIRQALGRKNHLCEQDKLVCLRNDSVRGVYNGQLFIVKRLYNDDAQSYHVNLTDEIGTNYYDVPLLKRGFDGLFDQKKEQMPRNTCLFDYGYVLTCHKSQGSEWDSVLCLEQWMPAHPWDMSKWRYTAVTRASRRLIYVR